MDTEYSEAITLTEGRIASMTSLYRLSINMGEFGTSRMLSDIIYDLHWDNYGCLMRDIASIDAKMGLNPWNSEDLRDIRGRLMQKRRETVKLMDDLIVEDLAMPIRD